VRADSLSIVVSSAGAADVDTAVNASADPLVASGTDSGRFYLIRDEGKAAAPSLAGGPRNVEDAVEARLIRLLPSPWMLRSHDFGTVWLPLEPPLPTKEVRLRARKQGT
jgi:hypothetical protein